MRNVADRIERILREREVDAYEISAMDSERTTVESKDGSADFISESDSRAFAVRLLKGNRLGYAFSMSEDESSLFSMVDGALFATTYQDEDEQVILPEGPQAYPESPGSIEEGAVDLGRKARFAVDLEMLTRGVDEKIRNVRYATLKETRSRFYLRSSRGIEGEYGKSLYLAFVYAVAEHRDQSETGFGLGFAGTFDGIEGLKGKIATEAAEKGLRMLGSRRIKTGRYPAIIENGAMTELLSVLIPSVNGRNVVLGKSMLKGKRGEQVFSSKVTLVDDPLMEGGAGSCPFDGEGVSSRRVDLIKEGICGEYLADSYWGRKLGTGSTASLRRGNFKTGPEIGISNFYITPGGKRLEELMGDLGRGVLLTGFMGIHTADPVSGDFSVGASGIYFEGGRKKYPVRTFAVSGNIVELMRNVVDVGEDIEMFGSTGSPSIAFECVDVGGE